jgi:ABC-type transporter Mla subunit MlaD
LFRKIILALIVAVGIAVLSLFAVQKHAYSQRVIKSCLIDAKGLRSGAGVRIAGVDVGIVRSVRANTEDRACPAEIEMDIATAYELKIPKDSLVEVQSGGLLGPPLISIDISHASGEPIENYGYLKSKPTVPADNIGDHLKVLDQTLRRLDESIEANGESRKANSSSSYGGRQSQKKP